MSYERLFVVRVAFLESDQGLGRRNAVFVVTRCAGTNEGKILVHPVVVDFVFFIHWFAT